MLLKGALAGLIISASVGPVNLLCVSRALTRGSKAGIISGLGAATADTVYGAIAGFSVQFVIGFLIREEFWIRLIGGSILVALGIWYLFRTPQKLEDIQDQPGESDYVSALLLNLSNPTTVLSFLAVLTALGLRHHDSWLQAMLLVAGIFLAAMLWWVLLATVASRFHDRLNDRALLWMNRLAGIAMSGFGVVTVALSKS